MKLRELRCESDVYSRRRLFAAEYPANKSDSLPQFYKGKDRLMTKKYEIEKLGAFGEGVARNGKVVFIKGALPGETVLAEDDLIKKSFIRAKLIKVLKSGPDRVDPPCPHFLTCGGCTLQHLSYKAQLALKAQTVTETLFKVAGISVKANKVVSSSPFRYRNKLSFPVRGKKVGLYTENSHDVVDISECLLQKEWNKTLISALRLFMHDYGFCDNDERHGIRHIVAREKDGIICIVLVTAANVDVSHFADYVPFENFALYQNINERDNNVILGEKYCFISGKGRFPTFHPASFYQVNDEIEKELYADVCDCVKDAYVIDAYCGAGNLTMKLARSAKAVVGVEIVPQAIDEAREKAKTNRLNNVSFICGDCAVELPKLKKKFDMGQENEPFCENGSKKSGGLTVVFDPPRKGVNEKALSAVAELKPNRIVYISCNPATLARDLTLLPDYRISTMNIYDMFPQTTHVETLVLLSHKKPDGHIGVTVEFGDAVEELKKPR